EPSRGPGELQTPQAVRATGRLLDSQGVLMLLACHPATSRELTPSTLADHPCHGYPGPHERGHAYPVRPRAGRPQRRRAAAAPDLRRAPAAGGPEAGPGE